MEKLSKINSGKKEALLLIILGLVLIGFFGTLWLNRNQEINREDLISIEGIMNKTPELRWERRVGRTLTMKLREYPLINFKVGRFGMPGLKPGLSQGIVSNGNRISVDILKEDYLKLSGNGGSSKRTIYVYGVRDENEEYLNVNNYNLEKKKDRNSLAMYLFLGFSFWAFGYGIYLLMENKKKAGTGST